METLNLTFKNRNNIELSARLDLPTGKPKAYALFAHCFSCSKNIKAAYHISHMPRNRNRAGSTQGSN